MKKFVFSLASVYKYKKSIEKKQEADLAAAWSALRGFEHQKEDALARRDDQRRQFRLKLKENKNVVFYLEKYGKFLHYMDTVLKAIDERIEQAKAEVMRCQRAIVETKKEIKALEHIKDIQYQQHLEDIKAEEETFIGDLISFQTARPDEEDLA